MLLVPGMIFTIEPMINMGKKDIYVDSDNDWTAITEDGSPSAQWEYTVLITEDGAEINKMKKTSNFASFFYFKYYV